MKKLLIGCLIALIIGNLTGCTNKKVNNETNETNTTTDENTENQETNTTTNEVSETQEINETNTITNENTDTQKINETEEYQPEYVTVNYNNEGIYQYKIIKCDQNKAEELKEYGKSFKENTNVTLTFANGSKFEGLEHKYGQNGEYCYIRIINGDKIETYDVLEINPIDSLVTGQTPKHKYEEKYFKLDFNNSNDSLTVKVVKCTEEEVEYLLRTKFADFNGVFITDEANNSFQGFIGHYGYNGERTYINLYSGRDSYYYRVIE